MVDRDKYEKLMERGNKKRQKCDYENRNCTESKIMRRGIES